MAHFYISDNQPVNPVSGDFWFKPSDNKVYKFDGSAWNELAGLPIDFSTLFSGTVPIEGLVLAYALLADTGLPSAVKAHFVKSAAPTVGTGGVYGAAVDIEPAANKSILPLQVKTSTAGTFGTGETVTVRVTATFSDGTTASVTKTHSAAGDIWFAEADLAGLMKDGAYITKLSVDATSSAATTAVIASVDVYGLQV